MIGQLKSVGVLDKMHKGKGKSVGDRVQAEPFLDGWLDADDAVALDWGGC